MTAIKILILLGAPGAGKGTVAQYLKDKYAVSHFSTGNLLREEVKSESDIGLKVKDLIGSGKLVGDDIVNAIVEKNIGLALDEGKLIILDGYPRTVAQAEVLDEIRSGSLRAQIRVLALHVENEVVVARISQRRVCEKCGATYGPHDKVDVCSCGGKLIKRKDDEESVVRNRLKEYEAATLPIVDYYSDRVFKISGEGAPEEVASRVSDVLAQLGIEEKRR